MTNNKIKELIAKIALTEPTSLKIKGTGSNSPRSVHYYNSNKEFVPDIVATYSNKKNYYSIESKINKNDIPLLTFKWILFSSEARKTGGIFSLVLEKSNVLTCEKIIHDKQLDIEIIEI